MTTATGMFRGHREVVAGKVLIGLNVAVWVWMVVRSGDPSRAAGPVFVRGAMYGPAVAEGEWWRLVTGAFLHSGITHLGMNMLLLWFLAQEMEPSVGPWTFTVLYGVSLAGGSLGIMLLSPEVPTVGASGAVFGLMGALVVLQVRARQNPWRSGVASLVLVNVVFTFLVPGISVGGHLGGLVAGAAAATAVPLGEAPSTGTRLRHVVLAAAAVMLLVLARGVATDGFDLVP